MANYSVNQLDEIADPYVQYNFERDTSFAFMVDLTTYLDIMSSATYGGRGRSK